MEVGDTTLDPNAPNASVDAGDKGHRFSRKLPIRGDQLDTAWKRLVVTATAIRDAELDYDVVTHGAAAFGEERDDPPVPEDKRGMRNSNSVVRTVLESVGIDYSKVLPMGVRSDDLPGIETVLNPGYRPYTPEEIFRAQSAGTPLFEELQYIQDPDRMRTDEYNFAPLTLDLLPHHPYPIQRPGWIGQDAAEAGDAGAVPSSDMAAAATHSQESETGSSGSVAEAVATQVPDDAYAQAMIDRHLPTVAQPADDPVDRALEAGPGALSDADRGRAMRHDAYWENTDPRRDALHHAIREGYRKQFGTGPQTYDETGKPVKPVELVALPAQTPAPRAATGQPLQAMLGGLGNLLRQAGQATGPAAAVQAWQTAVNTLDKPTETEVAQKRPPRGTLAGLDRPDLAPPLVPALDELTEDGVFDPKTAAKTRRVLTKRHPQEVAGAFDSVFNDLQNKNQTGI